MHTITTRSPTDDERRIMVEQAKPDVASFGCLVLVLGVGPALALGWIGAWVARMFSNDAGPVGRWLGWGIGLVILLIALTKFVPYERRQHRRAAADLEGGIVEDIAVTDARVIEIGLISNNEPILAFDIGADKILFMQGQWLRDSKTYGADEPTHDVDEAIVNSQESPFSFPSESFTLTRLPHSGHVLHIHVSGPYLPPESTVEALRPEFEFGDSEVFTGLLDNIADVLAREHSRRVD